MAILALFGLPCERILNASLGSDTFFASSIVPQMYGSYEAITFDYSNETYIQLEFFYDNDEERDGYGGYRYSRFYLAGYKKYPDIPKVPVPFSAKPPTTPSSKDGDPIGVYSKVASGEPTGEAISHTGPTSRIMSSNNPKTSSTTEKMAAALAKTAYMQQHSDLTSEQYDLMYPMPRNAVMQYFGDWSGGKAYYPSLEQGTTESGAFIGGYSVKASVPLNQGGTGDDLKYTTVPVRVFDDSDTPPPWNRMITMPASEDSAAYATRWATERAAAVERERPLRVENSDRVIGQLKAGYLPSEISTALLEEKPFFMESRLDPSFKIVIGDIELIDDPEVSGKQNPRENHPSRPYFYEPTTVTKYITPGWGGYTWSSGAREKLSAYLSFTVKMRRKVTIEFKVMDTTADPPAEVTKKYEYTGEMHILVSYTYADYPNPLFTRYTFNKWPLVGEDGLATYYGEFAEILDNLYAIRNMEVVSSSIITIEKTLAKAKTKRTEERDAIQASIDTYSAAGNTAQVAILQVSLAKANDALTKTTELHTAVLGKLPTQASELDKLRTPPMNIRALDKFGDGLFSAVLLTGEAAVDYARQQAQYINTEENHPAKEASRLLRAYYLHTKRVLDEAQNEYVLAQKTEDENRKTKATAARDQAVSDELFFRDAVVKSEAAELLGTVSVGNRLFAEQIPALMEYEKYFPAVSRGYYDI